MTVRKQQQRFAAIAPAAALLAVLALGAIAPATAQTKKYYLTPGEFLGGEALTACDPGFHMASFWELFSLTNLRYDTTRGFREADSGVGPPSGVEGWVRTGTFAAGVNTAGIGNCMAWTSSDPISGTTVRLDAFFNNAAGNASPWEGITFSCATRHRVWCKQN